MEALFLGLITVLFGGIACLAGYQLYRGLLPIWGFIAGFIWGAHIIDLALGEGFLASLTGWGTGIILGLAGALLAYAFYQAAVAMLAGIIGFYVAYGSMMQLGAPEGALTLLVALLSAAAIASMVVYFRIPKAIVMILTAVAGAAAVMGGVLVMSGQIAPSSLGARVVGDIISGSTLWSITWAALAVLGITAQALMDRSLHQQRSQESYSLSDRNMVGALGGEVERDQSNYNRFDDDEVETVEEFRRRRIAENDNNHQSS